MNAPFSTASLLQSLTNLAQLGLAGLITFPLAYNREKSEGGLGMRTFPLVAMAACGFLLIGQGLVDGDPDATARVLQGAITGVGFLGGGAIVKHGTNVYGTATAAAIWATAAIGVAVAYNRYEIAVALSLASFVTLRFLRPLKKMARRNGEHVPGADPSEAAGGGKPQH